MILGLLLFLLPGFLLTEIFFRKSSLLEKIVYNAMFTVCFSVAIGLLLGFNEFTYMLTGGFKNLTYYYIAFCVILVGIYLWKLRAEKTRHKKK